MGGLIFFLPHILRGGKKYAWGTKTRPHVAFFQKRGHEMMFCDLSVNYTRAHKTTICGPQNMRLFSITQYFAGNTTRTYKVCIYVIFQPQAMLRCL